MCGLMLCCFMLRGLNMWFDVRFDVQFVVWSVVM